MGIGQYLLEKQREIERAEKLKNDKLKKEAEGLAPQYANMIYDFIKKNIDKFDDCGSIKLTLPEDLDKKLSEEGDDTNLSPLGMAVRKYMADKDDMKVEFNVCGVIKLYGLRTHPIDDDRKEKMIKDWPWSKPRPIDPDTLSIRDYFVYMNDKRFQDLKRKKDRIQKEREAQNYKDNMNRAKPYAEKLVEFMKNNTQFMVDGEFKAVIPEETFGDLYTKTGRIVEPNSLSFYVSKYLEIYENTPDVQFDRYYSMSVRIAPSTKPPTEFELWIMRGTH
ncbi:MAG: hypothetical protein ACRC5M_06610 [Anaeroplasmataceae bacterium]